MWTEFIVNKGKFNFENTFDIVFDHLFKRKPVSVKTKLCCLNRLDKLKFGQGKKKVLEKLEMSALVKLQIKVDILYRTLLTRR